MAEISGNYFAVTLPNKGQLRNIFPKKYFFSQLNRTLTPKKDTKTVIKTPFGWVKNDCPKNDFA